MQNIADGMNEYIQSKIAQASKEIVDKHMLEISKEIEAERLKIVANAGLNIARNTSMEYLKDRLVITIVDRTKDNGF